MPFAPDRTVPAEPPRAIRKPRGLIDGWTRAGGGGGWARRLQSATLAERIGGFVCPFNGIVVNDIVDNELVDPHDSTNLLNMDMAAMKSSTGRWVSGDDFFDREPELRLLESRVRDGNHVLLTGQRRMGKTSVARELGRRLESRGWTSVFADVEGATCPEDAIADIAEAVHPVRSISARFADTMRRWVGENIEEISASEFRLKVRAGLSESWRRHGSQIIGTCADHDRRVLLVIDELPIFLMRMIREHGGARRVDEFLSWLRGVFQGLGGKSPVLIASGSIGLAPLVQRLGIPDRINYLHPFRLGPWDRNTSVQCFQLLAGSHGLRTDDGVAGAVYEALGILLKDWWSARFRDHHTPLESRTSDQD